MSRKVLSVLLLASLIPVVSCTNKKKLEIEYQKGYDTADKECIELQKEIKKYIRQLKAQVRQKELNCQDKWFDKQDDEPKGNEEWMK